MLVSNLPHFLFRIDNLKGLKYLNIPEIFYHPFIEFSILNWTCCILLEQKGSCHGPKLK